LNNDATKNNQKLASSMRSTIKNFESIYDIDDIKDAYENKLEEKYQY
jgi:ribosomal protein S20